MTFAKHFVAAFIGRPITDEREPAQPAPASKPFVTVIDDEEDVIFEGFMAVPPAVGDTWEGDWTKAFVVDHRIWDVARPLDPRHHLIVCLRDERQAAT